MRRNPILLLCALLASLLMIAACGSGGSAQRTTADVTMDEFMAMTADEKLRYCQQKVASVELQKCIETKPMEPVPGQATEAQIKAAMQECDKLGLESETPQELHKCAVQRLNGMNEEAAPYTEDQFKAAQRLCAEHYSGTVEVQSCVSALLHHINSDGTPR